jgi:peroxiredoxin
MNRNLMLWIFAALVTFIPAGLLPSGILRQGSNSEKKTTADTVGLAVGHRAPAFALKDQNGKEMSLDSLIKNGPIALVFYRSADWCIYCKQQIVELQQNLKEIETSGGGNVVGVSYDSVAVLKRYADRRSITFPLLSDVGSKTIDAYGIRDKAVKGGVAHHGTFIIDRKGIIRAKVFQVSYAEREAVDNLIRVLKDAR